MHCVKKKKVFLPSCLIGFQRAPWNIQVEAMCEFVLLLVFSDGVLSYFVEVPYI